MKGLQGILWAERARDEFPALAAQGTVVIVPIASIEQHGIHLPVNTDCRSVEAVAYRAACTADVPILVTPTLAYGVSPHHMMFPGTLSLRVETAVRMLRDICECIIAHGFGRILVLSGHGGNRGTIDAAAQEMRHQLKRPIYGACWFDLAAEAIKAIREGPHPTIGHSGEMETSILLAFHPETVRQDKLVVVPGITDTPTRATAAKGERAVQAGADAVIAFAHKLFAMPLAEPPAVELTPEG